jgi:hypothetical protein
VKAAPTRRASAPGSTCDRQQAAGRTRGQGKGQGGGLQFEFEIRAVLVGRVPGCWGLAIYVPVSGEW